MESGIKQLNKSIEGFLLDRGIEEPELKTLFTSVIQSAFGYYHKYYEKNCADAKKYHSIVTGVDQSDYIAHYKEKESLAQKANRVKTTSTRTVGVASTLEVQFDRIFRKPRIIDSFTYAESARTQENTQQLQGLISDFYAGKSVDAFLKDFFINLNFIDPNAFIIVAQSPNPEDTRSFPVIAESKICLDYKYLNGILQYLTIDSAIGFLSYGMNYQLKGCFIEKGDYVPEGAILFSYNDKTLAIQVALFPSVQVPAIQIGTCANKETMMQTRASIITPAVNEFNDLMNTKSELDLTEKHHVFPKMIQRGTPCEYESNGDHCHGGYMAHSGETCPSCYGTGWKPIVSSQDVLIVKGENEDGSNVSIKDYIGYPELPFSIVDFLDAKVKFLPSYISKLIFGTDVTKLNDQANAAATATEVMAKVDSMNGVLGKQAEHMSEVKVFIILQIAINAGIFEGLAVSVQAPQSFSILSVGQLLDMLKKAKESTASTDIIERIEADIREKQNEDNPFKNKVQDMKVFFKPFKSISETMREAYVFGLPDNNKDKLLFLYEDKIYNNILMENPEIFEAPRLAQALELDKQVERILSDMLENTEPIRNAIASLQDIEEDLEDE